MTIRSFALLALLCATVAAPGTQARTTQALTIERLFADPALDGGAPRALRYAPDGSRVTYLKARDDDYERYDLWEYHLADAEIRLLVDSASLLGGDEQLSDEEKARRERQRIYGKGIMEYTWAENSAALLFPLGGDVYLFDLATQTSRRLTDTTAFETDVRTSPGGRYVSFIREQDIFVVDLETGTERALTRDGEGPVKNGMAEFVAQEEMDRLTGYWWSPDDRHLAFLRVDESPVDLVTRSEIYADRIDMIEQRYPAAGRPNVALRLGIISLETGAISWIDLGGADDFYIPRVAWATEHSLSFQWQSRDQQALELRLYDLEEGSARVLLREESATWLNLHDDLYFFADGERFLWSSERSGFRHLYLYSVSEGLIRPLTAGDWAVDELALVDEDAGAVYFTGRKDTPLERHLYRVNLEGADALTRLSSRSGMHKIEFAEDGRSYLDQFSTALTPPQVSLHAPDGEHLAWIEENAVEEGHPLYPYSAALIRPQFGSFTATSGQELFYRMLKPAPMQPERRYPALVYVYGGPGAQVVKNQWDRLFLQYLAQQGYVVFSVDNRGSTARGKRFEDPIFERMGSVEVEDQLAGVEFLKTLPYVDAERIGIYGHSYGGYMTLMSLLKAPGQFAAGVSGAPVTDWLLYDTHYTERYMGHPAANAERYRDASVFPYVENLRSPLLLYHGMADDNVLFTHSTRLIKALQDGRKRFELMTYPGKKHSIRGKDTRIHLYTTIAGFLKRHLQPER